jgi:hypothetical protein
LASYLRYARISRHYPPHGTHGRMNNAEKTIRELLALADIEINGDSPRDI